MAAALKATLKERPFDGPLAGQLSTPPGRGLRFFWLGQAGFVVDVAGRRLVIDPYLSDSLAEKYRGTLYPHERMMPAPVAPGELAGVDCVLCTHAHTDHMDPGTLPALFSANPGAVLVAPKAVREAALQRSGLGEDRLRLLDAGETLVLDPSLRITASRAAHETLERDEAGHHRFLGFLIAGDGVRLWHSGDCVPFDGLVEEVSALSPDIALLPVNGRRRELSERGIAGNFTLAEAVETARAVGAGVVVAHHYGLFDFNTADPQSIDSLARSTSEPRILRAREAIAFEWPAT